MSKFVKSKLDSKVLGLPGYLMGLCVSKDIEVIDNDTFVLNGRKVILDYHTLTGDYKGMFRNLFEGKAILNESQLDEYQRKNFLRVNRKFKDSIESFIYTDVD